MRVYIRDMEMPTRCCDCKMYVEDIYCCHLLNREIENPWADDGVELDCPLVPVPPHGRLGDLDKLEQIFVDIDNAPYSGFDGSEPFYSAEDAAQIIRLSPTIIPAEEG